MTGGLNGYPEDYARLCSGVENPFLTADRYEGEYRVRHEDGHWIDVWERGCLRRDEQGEPIGVVGFTTDITDRKRTQTALETAHTTGIFFRGNLLNTDT